MTWPVKIRVRPEGRALYATAYVWPTKKAMRAHAYANKVWRRRDKFGAYCQTFTKIRVHADGRCRTSPEFAEVHFALSQMGSETIVHEFTHAAWGWARRTGWRVDEDALASGYDNGSASESEERFCYALGAMVRQFVNRAHALGVYDPSDGKG